MSMLYCPRWTVPSNCKPRWAPPFLVSVRYFVTATRKLTNTAGKAWWWVWPHPWWSASVRDVSIYSRPRNRERTVVRLDHKPQEPPPTTTFSEVSPSESSTATPNSSHLLVTKSYNIHVCRRHSMASPREPGKSSDSLVCNNSKARLCSQHWFALLSSTGHPGESQSCWTTRLVGSLPFYLCLWIIFALSGGGELKKPECHF